MMIASVFLVVQVIARPEDSAISANCLAAQSILKRLEKADISTRINRGSDYDKLLNLMFAMNARLASNRIAAPELSEITAQFSEAIDKFRSHYDGYNDDLDRVTDIKCNEKPGEFYDFLEKTRISRKKLHEDVGKLKELFSEYKNKLNALVEDRS